MPLLNSPQNFSQNSHGMPCCSNHISVSSTVMPSKFGLEAISPNCRARWSRSHTTVTGDGEPSASCLARQKISRITQRESSREEQEVEVHLKLEAAARHAHDMCTSRDLVRIYMYSILPAEFALRPAWMKLIIKCKTLSCMQATYPMVLLV